MCKLGWGVVEYSWNRLIFYLALRVRSNQEEGEDLGKLFLLKLFGSLLKKITITFKKKNTE